MFQNIPADKVLDVVKQGPTVPAKIAKVVGGDTMIVGAVLSTLISQGKVKVSSLKFGGSPLYYATGDEQKLEDFTSNLNNKDQKTVFLLKEHKVLQDSIQDPLIRVSLRAIKDFAKSFEVNIDGVNQLFWRYYLVSSEDATNYASKKYFDTKPSTKVESQKKFVEPIPAQKIIEESDKLDIESAESTSAEEILQSEKQEISEKKSKTKVEKTDKEDFFEQIKKHITAKNLDIIGKEKIKKSEYSLVLKNHDTNEYIYCKAKDKKSINEGDLASAFVFAQNKKMTCLFITTGSLTKKAEGIIHKEFPGMIFERIE